MKKLWGGRFEGKTDEVVETFTESISFDARLARFDILGSIAHARMLGAQRIITSSDAKRIVTGLQAILKDVEAGRFLFDPKLEDVHSNIEAALVARIGDAGKRLHTARSRNDQVALDMRLWTREQADAIVARLRALRETVVEFAETHLNVVLPGLTHLQHAQPVLLAHHFMAYYEMFSRDSQRFTELRKRINVMPLGSAALAGTPHPIDRRRVARELGFDAISANSMDAVSDRDFLIEFCASASLAMMHLSRLSEEIILWSTPEFGFIRIGDAFTTGSSIMPQKKNPDVAELLRGKTGRVYGALMALLTIMKGLPLTYNRDLQEDKQPVFDVADTLQASLTVVTRMVPSIRVNREAMRATVDQGFLEATDLADYLVKKGLPFRKAHEIVGRIVLYCEKNNKTLPDLGLDAYQMFSPLFNDDVRAALAVRNLIQRRDNPGGTAPNRVREAIRRAKRLLR